MNKAEIFLSDNGFPDTTQKCLFKEGENKLLSELLIAFRDKEIKDFKGKWEAEIREELKFYGKQELQYKQSSKGFDYDFGKGSAYEVAAERTKSLLKKHSK